MKIVILNGSPRLENTAAMVDAFKAGAEEKGHEVEVIHVGRMNISGCVACEYCHTKGEGKCVKRDDMDKVIPSLMDADMMVLASPIYYFTMTAQISAALQRVYCIDHPPKVKKMALLLSSASPNTWDGAIGEYKGILKYYGAEDMGMVIAQGDANKTDAKMNEVKELALTL